MNGKETPMLETGVLIIIAATTVVLLAIQGVRRVRDHRMREEVRAAMDDLFIGS